MGLHEYILPTLVTTRLSFRVYKKSNCPIDKVCQVFSKTFTGSFQNLSFPILVKRRVFYKWYTRRCQNDENFLCKLICPHESMATNNSIFMRRNTYY